MDDLREKITRTIYGKEIKVQVEVEYTEPEKLNYIEKTYKIYDKKIMEDRIKFTIQTREKLLSKLQDGEYNVKRIQDNS
jgi:50S ribosomal subunit-associated GTPase HflX